MKIELISSEQFDVLSNIQQKHSILTYQNKGYDGFDKSKMTDADKLAFKEVSEILSKHIKGFSSFQNFRLSKKTNEIELRFQYNYSYDGGLHFTGVGYITLRELKNGFDK
jgi:hypothetical protein